MKLHTFTIPQGARAEKLYAYARRMLPQTPPSALREAFQKRDVKVDGKRVGLDAVVTPGTEVRIYTRDVPVQRIPVLFEDENVLVAVKPAGVSCEPDAKGGCPFPALLQQQMGAGAQEPLLCHRLDNPTEGLMLLAKTPEAQQTLVEAFRSHQVHKEYACLVRGTPKPPKAVCTAWLQKDALHATVRVFAQEREHCKQIVTEYEVLSPGECARLRVRLHTGRTHQIRAHMAFLGHPLLGDDRYGDRAFNKRMKARRLMLCATGLSFALEGPLAYLNERRFAWEPSF